PEEGEVVPAPDVEEEVLPHARRQLDGLDQRHAEDVRVEVDGAGHVAAHEGEVVDALVVERSRICHVRCLPHPDVRIAYNQPPRSSSVRHATWGSARPDTAACVQSAAATRSALPSRATSVPG